MLANKMGGLDWSALPLAVEYHGVENVEALIDDLLVIKSHKGPEDSDDDMPS